MDRTLPQVDVLIPVHNRPKLLGKCLQTLLVQSFSNFRILIWEDGALAAAVEKVAPPIVYDPKPLIDALYTRFPLGD